jgi:hypothetical protein
VERGKEEFFFEKKNQKTFAPGGRGNGSATAPNEQKFFASFFQKRSACFVIFDSDAVYFAPGVELHYHLRNF